MINKLVRLSAAVILSLSSLLIVSVPAAFAAGPFTCTWTGNGGNANFSTAGNWTGCNGTSPQPADGDQLIFPGGLTNETANNNLSGASFAEIVFNGGSGTSGYIITGNAITIGNILDSSNNANGNELALDMTVSGPSREFTSSATSDLVIGDLNNIGSNTVNFSGDTLNLVDNVFVAANLTDGSGDLLNIDNSTPSLAVDLLADNPGLTSNVHVTSGIVFLDGANANATVSADGSDTFVKGNGGVKTLNVSSSATLAPGDSPGCLSVGSLNASGGTFQEDIQDSTTPCTDFDQTTVTSGQVTLTNATLNVSFLNNFQPTVGTSFTIIKNQFGGPVNGTFKNLTEGSTLTVGSVNFTITYQGNNENDVVLTVSSIGSLASSGSSSSSAPKAPNTGLALVAANPLATLAASVAATLVILGIVRRLKPARQ
jgi:hypothetical protein